MENMGIIGYIVAVILSVLLISIILPVLTVLAVIYISTDQSLVDENETIDKYQEEQPHLRRIL